MSESFRILDFAKSFTLSRVGSLTSISRNLPSSAISDYDTEDEKLYPALVLFQEANPPSIIFEYSSEVVSPLKGKTHSDLSI